MKTNFMNKMHIFFLIKNNNQGGKYIVAYKAKKSKIKK